MVITMNNFLSKSAIFNYVEGWFRTSDKNSDDV